MSQVPESGGTSQDGVIDVAPAVNNQKPPTVNEKSTAPLASAPSTAVKHKNHSGSGGLDPRPGGSASSAAPTDDAESQATTTNDHTVDESGDSESGGHNEPGKMFVGGLSWQTSAEGLRDYFCKFGEVNECMVMRDPTTKRARGFGFITFVDPAAVEKVLAVECHELDGKRIDPKIAFPKKQQPKMVIKTKKVFIGGLSSGSTLDDIKTYFSQYGKIEDAMLMFDKSTQRHRGFGFITFDDDEVSDKVCEIHFHEINGKMVECKKAQPKEVMLPLQLNKTRAAAARNLYGLAPEQLLAYASYIPRLPAGAYGPPTATAAHHHGMALAAYPGGVTAAAIPSAAMAAPHHFAAGNGHFQAVASSGHGGPFALAAAHTAGAARHQMSNNGANAGLNPRDLAAAQLIAQQQAVYEAAMIYSQMAAQSADLSAGAAFAAHAHQHAHHQHQHGHAPIQMHQQQLQQQPQTPIAQYPSVPIPSTAVHSAAAGTAQPAIVQQPQQFGKP